MLKNHLFEEIHHLETSRYAFNLSLILIDNFRLQVYVHSPKGL